MDTGVIALECEENSVGTSRKRAFRLTLFGGSAVESKPVHLGPVEDELGEGLATATGYGS